MRKPGPGGEAAEPWRPFSRDKLLVLALSLLLQLAAGALLGHQYDMRIFMATGYLTGTGQNPYVAQDTSAVFRDPSFRGITTVGYPPPWPLLLGLLYRGTFAIFPSLRLYNLALKLPIIAANVGLAFLVAGALKSLGARAAASRKAWVFLLLNPFLLYFGTAWGQFDSAAALLSLSALLLLHSGRLRLSALLLALAVSFKPTALPLVPVALAFLIGRPLRRGLTYLGLLLSGLLLFCVLPFLVFRWSPAPILQGWNAHFTVAGGLSALTFLQFLSGSSRLPGGWWLLGMAWLPALGAGILALRPGQKSVVELLKESLALTLLFFLNRTWLSEPNVIQVLPLVLLLHELGELDAAALASVWVLPLVFTFFNTSPAQLLFPAFPEAMQRALKLAAGFSAVRVAAQTAAAVLWLAAGWRVVMSCLRKGRTVWAS